MSALADKLKLAAGAVAEVTAELGQQADEIVAMKEQLIVRGDKAIAPHRQMLKEAQAGIAEIEAATAQLSNSTGQ